MRAIVGARVSHLQDESKVSHLAQTETGLKRAEAQGYQVVGTFEDLGISAGKYTPFTRPGLSVWLDPEKIHEWDVIIFSKIDRAFRSTDDCIDFARWCKDHGKILEFVDDTLFLNYKNPKPGLEQMMADLFLYLGAFFAAIELERFRSRAQDRARALRNTDRWGHGKPPLGFRVVDHPKGIGKALAHDPDGQARLHDMANRLMAGETLHSIAKSYGSIPSSVAKMLTSPATQGIKLYKGKALLDGQGQPVRVGPKSFTDETWQKIQDAVAERKFSGKRRKNSENPLLGVAFCEVCKAALTQHRQTKGEKTYAYYRCYNGCKGVQVDAADLEARLEEEFLALKGDEPITKRVFVPGEDRSYELEEIKKSIARLRRESDLGLLDDEEMYFSRLTALRAKQSELEASPIRSPHWEDVRGSQTHSEAWFSTDDPLERRKQLQEAQIKIWVTSRTERRVETP